MLDLILLIIASASAGFAVAAFFNARSYDRGWRDGQFVASKSWQARPIAYPIERQMKDRGYTYIDRQP